MLFPAGGQIDDMSYTRNKDTNEFLTAGILNQDNSGGRLRIRFNKELSNYGTTMKDSKDLLKSELNITEPFQKVNLDKTIIYVAPFQIDEGAFGFGGIIYRVQGKGSVEAVYYEECSQSQEDCNEKEIKKRAYKIMSSINFIKMN